MFNYRETQMVLGMLARGDRQHDIAAYFGVNGGRVGELATGDHKYPSAVPMSADKLPPPGPYVTKYAVEGVINTLNEAIEAIEMAVGEEELADVRAALQLAKETLQNKIDELEGAAAV